MSTRFRYQWKTSQLSSIFFWLMILKAKSWGWCTNLSFESLEWAVQYSWGCSKRADLSRLLAASFTLTHCTGGRDRRCEWPVRTPRLVPPPALWEIWEEDLFCWDFLACSKQGVPLGSPRLKQWAAESDAWIASTYTLFAPLLWSTAAWLITVTHLSSLLSSELDWVSFNKSAF